MSVNLPEGEDFIDEKFHDRVLHRGTTPEEESLITEVKKRATQLVAESNKGTLWTTGPLTEQKATDIALEQALKEREERESGPVYYPDMDSYIKAMTATGKIIEAAPQEFEEKAQEILKSNFLRPGTYMIFHVPGSSSPIMAYRAGNNSIKFLTLPMSSKQGVTIEAIAGDFSERLTAYRKAIKELGFNEIRLTSEETLALFRVLSPMLDKKLEQKRAEEERLKEKNFEY